MRQISTNDPHSSRTHSPNVGVRVTKGFKMTKETKKMMDVITCAVITTSGDIHKFPIPLSSEIDVLKINSSYVFKRIDNVTVIYPVNKVVRVEYVKTQIEINDN